MNLCAEDCVKVGNDLYLIAKDVNLIYKVDVNTGKLEIIDSLFDAPIEAVRVGASIIEHNNKLYFPPMNARWLSFYEIDSHMWDYVKIETIDNCYWDRFFKAVIDQNVMHMIGSKYPAIVLVNLENKQIKTIGEETYKSLQERKEKWDDCYFRKDFAIVDGILYAASCVSNQLLVYDLKNQLIHLKTIGDRDMRFSGIAYDGKKFWITAREKLEFYCWNPKDGLFDAYKIKDVSIEQCYLGGAVFDGKNVILTGMVDSDSYFFDPNSEDVISTISVIRNSYVFVKNYEDIDYCMTPDGIIEERTVDDFKKIVRRIDAKVDDKDVYDYVGKKYGVIHENQTFSLKGFINILG